MASRQTTLTDVLAEQGRDIIEVFETIKHERELAKRYGIDLESEGKVETEGEKQLSK